MKSFVAGKEAWGISSWCPSEGTACNNYSVLESEHMTSTQDADCNIDVIQRF